MSEKLSVSFEFKELFGVPLHRASLTLFICVFVLLPVVIACTIAVLVACVFIILVELPIRVKRRYLGPHSEKWQKWFAWRPVRIDGTWVWFQSVIRKAVNNHDGFAFEIDYALIGEPHNAG